jgi:ribosomal protein S18 acetylase RimI-like enzyme
LFEAYEQEVDAAQCFQNFQAELDALPGDYAPPTGCLLLAEYDGQAAGCIALRPLDDDRCEMKRLYVRPDHRGHQIGRLLTEALIRQARARGYRALRLETTPAMEKAVALYAGLGFREIPPYSSTPAESTLFMELLLTEANA